MYLPHNGTRFRLCEATLDATAVLGHVTKHHFRPALIERIGRGLTAADRETAWGVARERVQARGSRTSSKLQGGHMRAIPSAMGCKLASEGRVRCSCVAKCLITPE